MRKLLLLLLIASAAMATEVLDLGHGLGYLRAKTLDDGLAALSAGRPLVLDLRRATTTTEAAARLNLLLMARRPTDASLFILIGPDTPAKLGAVLKAKSARTFLLGVEASAIKPDVIVAQSTDDDRRAYDALDRGTPLAELISGKVEKERFDEATLVAEFKNGSHDAHPSEPPAASVAPAPAKLTDRVLQRAVHLHRALLVLRR